MKARLMRSLAPRIRRFEVDIAAAIPTPRLVRTKSRRFSELPSCCSIGYPPKILAPIFHGDGRAMWLLCRPNDGEIVAGCTDRSTRAAIFHLLLPNCVKDCFNSRHSICVMTKRREFYDNDGEPKKTV